MSKPPIRWQFRHFAAMFYHTVVVSIVFATFTIVAYPTSPAATNLTINSTLNSTLNVTTNSTSNETMNSTLNENFNWTAPRIIQAEELYEPVRKTRITTRAIYEGILDGPVVGNLTGIFVGTFNGTFTMKYDPDREEGKELFEEVWKKNETFDHPQVFNGTGIVFPEVIKPPEKEKELLEEVWNKNETLDQFHLLNGTNLNVNKPFLGMNLTNGTYDLPSGGLFSGIYHRNKTVNGTANNSTEMPFFGGFWHGNGTFNNSQVLNETKSRSTPAPVESLFAGVSYSNRTFHAEKVLNGTNLTLEEELERLPKPKLMFNGIINGTFVGIVMGTTNETTDPAEMVLRGKFNGTIIGLYVGHFDGDSIPMPSKFSDGKDEEVLSGVFVGKSKLNGSVGQIPRDKQPAAGEFFNGVNYGNESVKETLRRYLTEPKPLNGISYGNKSVMETIHRILTEPSVFRSIQLGNESIEETLNRIFEETSAVSNDGSVFDGISYGNESLNETLKRIFPSGEEELGDLCLMIFNGSIWGDYNSPNRYFEVQNGTFNATRYPGTEFRVFDNVYIGKNTSDKMFYEKYTGDIPQTAFNETFYRNLNVRCWGYFSGLIDGMFLGYMNGTYEHIYHHCAEEWIFGNETHVWPPEIERCEKPWVTTCRRVLKLIEDRNCRYYGIAYNCDTYNKCPRESLHDSCWDTTEQEKENWDSRQTTILDANICCMRNGTFPPLPIIPWPVPWTMAPNYPPRPFIDVLPHSALGMTHAILVFMPTRVPLHASCALEEEEEYDEDEEVAPTEDPPEDYYLFGDGQKPPEETKS